MATAGEWTTLSPPLRSTTMEVIKELGFQRMTPVQASAIPLFLSNKDVAVEVLAPLTDPQAATGSGKTLAFVIPIIEILLRREEPLKKYEVGAIVISPIRYNGRDHADRPQGSLPCRSSRSFSTSRPN